MTASTLVKWFSLRSPQRTNIAYHICCANQHAYLIDFDGLRSASMTE